jgi:hypothetical protein
MLKIWSMVSFYPGFEFYDTRRFTVVTEEGAATSGELGYREEEKGHSRPATSPERSESPLQFLARQFQTC